MASAIGVELTNESIWSLSDELETQFLGHCRWISLDSAQPVTVELQLARLVNEATGAMMDVWLADSDRLLVVRPTSTAWVDGRHTGRRPARRARFVQEWRSIPTPS
jgi:hypothetical protein